VDAVSCRAEHAFHTFEVLTKRRSAFAPKKGAELHVGAATRSEVVTIRFSQCADTRVAMLMADTAVLVAMSAI
jgi:hypothetical protein